MFSDHPTHARGQRSLRCRLSFFALCGGPDGALSNGVVATGSRGPPRRCLSALSNDCAFLLAVVGKPGAAKDFWLVARSMGDFALRPARQIVVCLPYGVRFFTFSIWNRLRDVSSLSRRGPPNPAVAGAFRALSAAGQRPRPALDWAATRGKSGHLYLCRFSRARECPLSAGGSAPA